MKKQITFDNKKYNINLKGIDHSVNEKQFIQNNYLLKPAKKNLKPKMDMPSYSYDSILKNLKDERISLIIKNQENILLREEISDETINSNDEENDYEKESCKSEEPKSPIKKIKIKRKSYTSKYDDDISHSKCNIF